MIIAVLISRALLSVDSYSSPQQIEQGVKMKLTSAIALIPILFYICYKLWIKWRRSYWQRKGLSVLNVEHPKKKEHNTMKIQRIYKLAKSKGFKHVGAYSMFHRPEYIPIDLEVIKGIVLKDFSYFPNHGVYVNERDDPISAGLFHLEDERWRKMRVKLTPTFTSGKMKLMFPILLKCADRLEQILESHAKRGDPIDIKEFLARFTTDVIGACAFGIECNCLQNPDSDFRKYGKKQFDFRTWQRRIKIFMSLLLPHAVLRFLRFKFIDTEVEQFFINLVKSMVEQRETCGKRREDFLQLLIDMKNSSQDSREEDSNIDNKVKTSNNPTLTMNEITAQCLIFYNAGFETSSTTMTFALYELAIHPECQDKLRNEIKVVLNKYNGKLTYDAIMEMDYLDKVIDETLRKHPPLSNSMRKCSKPYKVPGTEITLDAGTRVIYTIHPIHMDPEYYPNPEEFNPENFSEENKAKRPPFTFMPFGEGPRMCIGMRFGKMQTKLGLVTVLNRYQVSLNKKTIYPLEYDSYQHILSVEGGVWLDLTII